ncbi:hypothetical protein LTR36_010141 [Oleoguttula mirabilis]|uniref:Dihydroorotate dehydrogenase (quinone), mitochondrial n=1 Tax=Oleoguttula mirabilis TaxID=1507867 RepID=A0AAV9JTA8_9PEZI|nr:hypothetical protein LTR36_010141 [Oleoguttula mirabilis]
MPGLQRLSDAPSRLLRASHGRNTPQWRGIERQLHHVALQSRKARRPTAALTLTSHLRTAQRFQSTTASAGSRVSSWIYSTVAVLTVGFGYLYITDTRASIHQWFVVPTLRLLHADPEEAHHAGIRYIKGLYNFNLHPRERGNHDQELGDLKVEVFGHVLDNPIGTSAGIDKNAEIPSPLLALGPAIVEVGGATPHPQEGNPQPRVFRIPSQNAFINRYGLNSEGVEHVAMQLRERVRQFAYNNGLGLDPESERIVLDGEAEVPPGSLVPGKLLAVQVAKNKTTPDNDIDAVARDYVICVEHLAKYADIIVVNVSSPNTPGLRDLQATGPLTAILSAVVDATKATQRKTKPAVMVKVSPDEDSDAQIDGICTAVWSSGVDGVIVGNTTKKRPDSIPVGYIMPAREEKLLMEMGGYSGPQMFNRTLDLVKRYRTKLDQGPADDTPPSAPVTAPAKSEAPSPKPSTPTSASSSLDPDPADASVQRDLQNLKPRTSEADKASQQPLIKLPERHSSSDLESSGQVFEPSSVKSVATAIAPPPTPAPPSTASNPPEPPSSASRSSSQPKDFEPKVIFATGGITNGEQCLEILNAGASVCQIYTAMMYGGVGTVTRMKREMREAMARQGRASAS